jgi:hypothetical protein
MNLRRAGERTKYFHLWRTDRQPADRLAASPAAPLGSPCGLLCAWVGFLLEYAVLWIVERLAAHAGPCW